MSTIRSYIVSIQADPGHLLIGGIKVHKTGGFQREADAASLLQTMLGIEREWGVSCSGKVVPSGAVPDHFVHCGNESQTYGAVCPGCGKRLTRAEARRTRAIPQEG
jgi:hypothetical protein